MIMNVIVIVIFVVTSSVCYRNDGLLADLSGDLATVSVDYDEMIVISISIFSVTVLYDDRILISIFLVTVLYDEKILIACRVVLLHVYPDLCWNDELSEKEKTIVEWVAYHCS